jgi:hypothetical protein
MDTRTGGWIWVVAVAATFGLAGCDDDDHGPTGPGDHFAPAVPRGVTSTTGDREVVLQWYPNHELDLSGYRIYRSQTQNDGYDPIAWVNASRGDVPYEEYVDRGVLNGRTYYYAVSAVDDRENESDLSPELVYDTPRPEGYDVHLGSYYDSPIDCAFLFRDELVTDFDDLEADIAYAYDDNAGVAWMWGLDDPDSGYVTELQDAGWHQDMDGVGWAPPDGWSEQAAVELIEGHIYVAWTRDDHYAKFQVVRVRADEVVVDWAYQTDRTNQELREEVPVAGSSAARPARRIGAVQRRASLASR